MYGMCANGCQLPANDSGGFCGPCKSRGGKKTEIKGRLLNTKESRWCPQCERLLSTREFYVIEKGGDKLQHKCKDCTSNYVKVRRRALRAGKMVVQTQAWLCVKCWSPLGKWDADHILPKSLGGTDEEENLQIMCQTCNRKKGNRESIDYRVFEKVANHGSKAT